MIGHGGLSRAFSFDLGFAVQLNAETVRPIRGSGHV